VPLTNPREESLRLGGFYVPRFEIKVNGADLSAPVLRDVSQITYQDNIKKLDGFELVVNNWDSKRHDFVYLGSKEETLKNLKSDTEIGKRLRLFEPGAHRLEIYMGYESDLTLMVAGQVTSLSPNFSGSPTLAVSGLNELYQLRKKPHTDTWHRKTESRVAELIGQRRNRFPIPIVIDPNAKSREQEIETISQENMPDIDFLLQRARQIGYVVVLLEEVKAANGRRLKPRRLFFGPSNSPILQEALETATHTTVSSSRDVTFVLEWGKSLIDFKPTFSTADQVQSVTVRGWNQGGGSRIREVAHISDLNEFQDCYVFNLLAKSGEDSSNNRASVQVRQPVFTAAQAHQRARAILSEKLKELVTVTGTTIGLPDLRSGKRIQIKGLGLRLEGTYFVTETTHTIGDAGYTTKFSARLEAGGGQR
jgi:uncharacterized protein